MKKKPWQKNNEEQNKKNDNDNNNDKENNNSDKEEKDDKEEKEDKEDKDENEEKEEKDEEGNDINISEDKTALKNFLNKLSNLNQEDDTKFPTLEKSFKKVEDVFDDFE